MNQGWAGRAPRMEPNISLEMKQKLRSKISSNIFLPYGLTIMLKIQKLTHD